MLTRLFVTLSGVTLAVACPVSIICGASMATQTPSQDFGGYSVTQLMEGASK